MIYSIEIEPPVILPEDKDDPLYPISKEALNGQITLGANQSNAVSPGKYEIPVKGLEGKVEMMVLGAKCEREATVQISVNKTGIVDALFRRYTKRSSRRVAERHYLPPEENVFLGRKTFQREFPWLRKRYTTLVTHAIVRRTANPEDNNTPFRLIDAERPPMLVYRHV